MIKREFGKITLTGISRTVVLTIAIGLLVLTTNSVLRADNKDTPDDVMRAGRTANAGLTTMMNALKETQAIASRLEKDRAYATRVLEASKRNDRQAVAALFKSEAPRSQIQIQSMADFKIEAIIITDGKQYYVCIGDGCKHRSGKSSPVVFEED